MGLILLSHLAWVNLIHLKKFDSGSPLGEVLTPAYPCIVSLAFFGKMVQGYPEVSIKHTSVFLALLPCCCMFTNASAVLGEAAVLKARHSVGLTFKTKEVPLLRSHEKASVCVPGWNCAMCISVRLVNRVSSSIEISRILTGSRNNYQYLFKMRWIQPMSLKLRVQWQPVCITNSITSIEKLAFIFPFVSWEIFVPFPLLDAVNYIIYRRGYVFVLIEKANASRKSLFFFFFLRNKQTPFLWRFKLPIVVFVCLFFKKACTICLYCSSFWRESFTDILVGYVKSCLLPLWQE